MAVDQPITLGRAREAVEVRLAEMGFAGGLTIVDVDEFQFGWVFYYDSKRHQDTQAFSDAIAGNAPILVDRRDGSLHVTGTGLPTSEYVADYIRSHP